MTTAKDERNDGGAAPTYLGNFAACEPWAAVGMTCAKCNVSWTGCWDNFQCPKCGEGELPYADPASAINDVRDDLAALEADAMLNHRSK